MEASSLHRINRRFRLGSNQTATSLKKPLITLG